MFTPTWEARPSARAEATLRVGEASAARHGYVCFPCRAVDPERHVLQPGGRSIQRIRIHSDAGVLHHDCSDELRQLGLHPRYQRDALHYYWLWYAGSCDLFVAAA